MCNVSVRIHKTKRYINIVLINLQSFLCTDPGHRIAQTPSRRRNDLAQKLLRTT